MERLTFRHDCPGQSFHGRAESCEPINCIDEYSVEARDAVVDRLAAYEDTGLTPVEINEARDEAYDLGYQSCLNYKGITWPEAAELQAYRALGTVEELSALVKAWEEGRVVALRRDRAGRR